MSARAAAFALIVASLCFGTSAPLARIASPAHPLVIAAGRTALAALLLGALTPGADWRSLARVSARGVLVVALAGGVLAAHFAAFLGGLAHTSLPAAATLVSLEPVSVVIVAALAFGERPRSGELVGVALATFGAVVVARGAGRGDHTLAGDALVVAAVALYGVYLALARASALLFPARLYATLVFAIAATLLSIVSLVAGVVALPSPRSALAIAALGVIPTLGGHTIVQWASRHVPPALVALVSPGETIGAIAISATLLGEPPGVAEMMGAVGILAGVGFVLASRRAPHG